MAAKIISNSKMWHDYARLMKCNWVLVPTMGNIHAGHVKLLRQAHRYARKNNSKVVVSIFVNPLQFDNPADYRQYPMTMEQDIRAVEPWVDAIFAPQASDLYSTKDLPLTISMMWQGEMTNRLCAAYRPGHFEGVLQVVAKLFNLIRPQATVFGQKDFQQLFLVQHLIKQMSYPIKLISVPTVRSSDKVALSSRNSKLSKDGLSKLPLLYQAMHQISTQIACNPYVRFAGKVNNQRKWLEKQGVVVEYLEVAEEIKLMRIEKLTEDQISAPKSTKLGYQARVFVGAYIEKVRFIDNLPLQLISSAPTSKTKII